VSSNAAALPPPTPDGEAFYRRCLTLIGDLEETESRHPDPTPSGLLRVEAQSTLARHFLLPGLPDFLARYPAIEISLNESNRWSENLGEDADCVLHFGHLANNDLIARDVITLPRITCASPFYLEKFGAPTSIDALAYHRMVGLRCVAKGTLKPLEFTVDNTSRSVIVPASISVSCLESALTNARNGLGLVQLPAFVAEADIARGKLVQILTEFPPPSVVISLLYARDHQLAPRIKIFLDWAVREFSRTTQSGPPYARSY